MKVTVFMIIVGIIFLCIFVGLLTLIVRALLKYIHSKDVRQEKSVVRKSLGEALKVHRTQCKMTQEFLSRYEIFIAYEHSGRQQAYTGRRLFFAKPETFSSRKPPIPMSVGA